MGNNYKWTKHDKRYSLRYAESLLVEKPKNPRLLSPPQPKKLKKQKTVTLCIHLHKLNPAKKKLPKKKRKKEKKEKKEKSLEIQRLVSTSPHEDKIMQHKTISLCL